MGNKEKLQIIRCSVDSSGKASATSDKYLVMLNPKDYQVSKNINYSKKCAFGQIGSDNKFQSISPQDLNISFTIDGTGAVPVSESGGKAVVVKDNIKSLESIVYDYQGKDHRPSTVKIVWGTLLYYGNLKSMDVKYILFKSDGTPLRAEISLKFISFMGSVEEEKIENKSSPDMTHIVHVKAGDTLPLLCNRIYEDSSYYIEVAKVNGLINFRNLEPGTKIIFPPLK